MMLHRAEETARVQLDAVVFGTKQRLEMSKALVITKVFPITNVDEYKRLMEERGKPALTRLMAVGELLQFRMELSEQTARSYEVWKDSESHAKHMSKLVNDIPVPKVKWMDANAG